MGKLPATEIEISALLAIYGVTGSERDRLLELTRHQTTALINRLAVDHYGSGRSS
jgi:hypothetical protein